MEAVARLSSALADRYQIELELGQGGRADRLGSMTAARGTAPL